MINWVLVMGKNIWLELQTYLTIFTSCIRVCIGSYKNNDIIDMCRHLQNISIGINNIVNMRPRHSTRLVWTDKCFESFSTCNPNTCSHWLTQSQKEADMYHLSIIGWHTLYFSSYWLSLKDLSLLYMSRLRWKLVQVEN